MKVQYSTHQYEAGCDEAGRGCLAGPVVAAAVILPKNFKNNAINDSKQLTEKQRNELTTIIKEQAIAFAIAEVDEREIEKINILHASILAMHKAIHRLEITPEFISVDGNKFKSYLQIPHQTIVKGDAKFINIAAASILAKTYRDEYMEKLHQQFPQYHWNQNKGYPTQSHRNAILEFGTTIHHRKTFKLIPNQLTLEL